jgi:hypothetical protein
LVGDFWGGFKGRNPNFGFGDAFGSTREQASQRRTEVLIELEISF